MIDVAKLSRTQNNNARRIKRLVEVGSAAAVAQALNLTPEAVRLAVRIADELEGAEAMWEIHTEANNR